MMKLNSARAAWHDALYTPWDSQGSHVEQIGLLGCSVQKTEKSVNSRHAMQQSVSARIQIAIASLPDDLRAFGNHMYSPLATDDEKDEAEDLLFQVAYQNSSRLAVMSAAKMMRARYVCAAILHRYRQINQGGQGEGIDPLPTVFKLRVWIYDTYGIELPGDQWARDWGDFVEHCFDACNWLDKEALVPVSGAIKMMKEAA
ncbi:hypothetical protein [Pseudomonas vancouverensis]|nr:hypothetical protein [Pseudomonas vancouverensis]SDU96878.1 hypothetical protein SAMN05216558_1293 [Pseudomonas vancouverensis]